MSSIVMDSPPQMLAQKDATLTYAYVSVASLGATQMPVPLKRM